MAVRKQMNNNTKRTNPELEVVEIQVETQVVMEEQQSLLHPRC